MRTFSAFAVALFALLCVASRAHAEECDPARFDTLIRFEWRRSFDSDIDVCAGKRGDVVAIFVTRRARDGVVTLHRDRRLAAADWTKLERVVTNAHLENVKSRTIFDFMTEADGATWTIRVDRGAVHQSAQEWAPVASAPTRVVGMAMLDLAGRDVIDGDVY